jgi:hypothetical protein
MFAATQIILDILNSQPLTLSLRLAIVFHAIPGRTLPEHMVHLAPELHADALVKAESLTALLGSRPDVDLPGLELVLSSSNDERLRRLGLSAL